MKNWKARLESLLRDVDSSTVPEGPRLRIRAFLAEVVVPAFEEVAELFQDLERDVEVEQAERRASIRILRDGQEEFFYEIRVRPYGQPDFVFPVISLKDLAGETYRAEAHLRHRPLEHDVTDLTRDELIESLLQEYEHHLRWHL